MDFDKKIFEQACRDYVLGVINESKYLRKSLVLVEHAKLYDWTKNKASYNQLATIIISESVSTNKPVTVRMIKELEDTVRGLVITLEDEEKPVAKKSVLAKKVIGVLKHPIRKAAAVAIKHPIYTTAGVLLGLYLFRKYMTSCGKKCKGDQACIKQCKADAIKTTIRSLESQMSNCRNTPKPEKCEAKLKKEIAKWNQKLTMLA